LVEEWAVTFTDDPKKNGMPKHPVFCFPNHAVT